MSYRRLRYQKALPIGQGDFIIQAAQALDAAAEIAVKSSDAKTLIKVSALWVHLSEHMSGLAGEAEEPEEEQEPNEIGFRPVQTTGSLVIQDDDTEY